MQCAVLTASLTDCAWCSAENCFNTGEQGKENERKLFLLCSPVFKQCFAEHHAQSVKEAVKTAHCTKHTVGKSVGGNEI